MWNEFLVAAAPTLVTMAGTVVTAAISLAANELRKRTGIEITDAQRLRLHDGAMNGIKMALASGKTVDEAPLVAAEYMRAYMPDTVKALNAGPALVDIAKAKLHDLVS